MLSAQYLTSKLNATMLELLSLPLSLSFSLLLPLSLSLAGKVCYAE